MLRLTRAAKLCASLVFLFLPLMIGCSGSSSSQQSTPAPSALSYSSSTLSLTVGTAITSLTPTVTGTVTSYAVSPALPAGLSLSTTSGVLSGTPTAAATSATYTVTASNASGSTTTTLTIAVATPVAPPSSLTYPKTTISAYVGAAIATDTPTVTGTVTAYAVSPALPAGLSLSTTTGAISGTPTAVTASAAYVVTASNSSGSTTATVTISVAAAVAPSALKYPTVNLRVVKGYAITADVPTFTGTPVTFTASPALPAGLTLDANTGAISGAPTTAADPAFFSITATNNAGSTSTKVQIYIRTVLYAAEQVTYPSTYYLSSGTVAGGSTRTLNLTVGEPAPALIPLEGHGLPSTYTVSPALPAGLSLDSSTGVISGTPTAVTPATKYTVSLTLPPGTGSGDIYIAVNKKPDTLFDVEGAGSLVTRVTSTRLLTVDKYEHWVLYDRTTGAKIASGNRIPTNAQYLSSTPYWPIDMKGNTIMIGIPQGAEIRSAIDGSLISIIASSYFGTRSDLYRGTYYQFSSPQLSPDGSYVVGCNGGAAEIFTLSGQWVTYVPNIPNNYLLAPSCVATNSAVLTYSSTSSTTTITLVDPVTGERTVKPAVDGAFSSFFLDGSHFITTLGAATWVNDLAGNRQLLNLPTTAGLGGTGNLVWTYDSITGALNIYPISSSTPVASYTFPANTVLSTPSPTLLAMYNAGNLSLVDLSGATISKTDYALPNATNYVSFTGFSAVSGTDWVAAFNDRLADGPTIANVTPRFYTQGTITAIAASSNTVAVALKSGIVQYFDASTKTLLGTINAYATDLALSSDGTTLAVSRAPSTTNGSDPGETQIYSLVSNSLVSSLGYRRYPILSSNGVNLGGLTGVFSSAPATTVTPAAGGADVWSLPAGGSSGVQMISPDLTLGVSGGSSAVNVYHNGVLTTAVPGTFVGWVDNNNLLVSATSGSTVTYTLYSTAGTVVSHPSLPSGYGANIVLTPTLAPISAFVPVDSDHIYSPVNNAIYQLSSGAVTWSWGLQTYVQAGANTPAWTNGVIAGPRVAFINTYRVSMDTY